MVRSHRGWTIPPGCGRAALGDGFHQGQGGSLGRWAVKWFHPGHNRQHQEDGQTGRQPVTRREVEQRGEEEGQHQLADPQAAGGFHSRSDERRSGAEGDGPHHDLVGRCAGPVAGRHRPGNRPLVRYRERPFLYGLPNHRTCEVSTKQFLNVKPK